MDDVSNAMLYAGRWMAGCTQGRADSGDKKLQLSGIE